MGHHEAGSRPETDSPRVSARWAPDSRVQPVLDHMKANLDRRLTVLELAQIAGLSPARFSHVFALTVGTTPGDYMNTLRLLRARQLLESNTMTIGEVASRVQFTSERNFIDTFEEHFGFRPDEVARTSRRRSRRVHDSAAGNTEIGISR